MVVKKIDIEHTSVIDDLTYWVIYYTDTITGLPSSIWIQNQTGNASTTFWNSYFVGNAIFDSNNFTTAVTGASSFSFQSKKSTIIITDYKGFEADFTTEIIGGFTFVISDVTVPDVPSEPTGLPLDQRTVINDASKIKFVNSPLFIREPAIPTTDSILVNLYVWSGSINTVVSVPTEIFNKRKVSAEDGYISIEISDFIKPFINPLFAYNRALPATVTNQGVFIQAQIIRIDVNGSQTMRYTPTLFCTLGYRWNYEQNIIGDNGVNSYGASGFSQIVNKFYNQKIPNYFLQDFDFSKTLLNATSLNIVKYNEVTPPPKYLRCTQDPTLIVFLNKLGLWESFTPHGKVVVNDEVKRVDTNIGHRDPSQVDNTYKHSKVNISIDVKQSYLINTGSLSEDMTSIVEELLYSPLVYLIRFKGDLELVTTVGITIDSTIITIDANDITIDSATVSSEYLGSFKTFQQVPVIITDEAFIRKTRLNDKISIDYGIKMSETNNKINNIR